MAFEVGTWVWNLPNKQRIWWPGKVVDIKTMPAELDYYKKKNKHPLACVYYERDKAYELVTNINHIYEYNCPQKVDFLKKGYLLFVKQQKRGMVIRGCDMNNFINDVKCIERDLDGDINIFDQFKPDDTPKHPQVNISELFSTSKDIKKRERRSLPSFKTHNPLKNAKQQPINKHAPISRPAPLSRTIKTPIVPGSFSCLYCSYSTYRYVLIRSHMNLCKSLNSKNKYTLQNKTAATKSSKSLSSSGASGSKTTAPRKRKAMTKKKTYAKKIKLQDELLKDWEDVDNTDDVDDANGQNDPVAEISTTESTVDIPVTDMIQNENTAYENKEPIIEGLQSENKETTLTRIFDFDDTEDTELNESFLNRSNQETNDHAKSSKSLDLMDKIIDNVNDTQLIKQCSTLSIQDECKVISFDDDEQDINTHTETKNIVTDVNCPETNNLNFKNNEDKIDSGYGSIENFLSCTLRDSSDWETPLLDRPSTHNGIDQGFDPVGNVDFIKNRSQKGYTKAAYRKYDLDTFLNLDLEKNDCDFKKEQPKVVESILNIYCDEVTGLHTDEELEQMEAFKQLREIQESFGVITITSIEGIVKVEELGRSTITQVF